MRYQTVLFDLDGTLLNTLEDLSDSLNFTLEKMGFPPRTQEEARCFVGNGVQRLMERAVPAGTGEEDIQRCLDIFREHYAQHMRDKTKPYDGILPLLEGLKKKGCQVGVISNKFDRAVKALCGEVFGDLVAVAIGESAQIRKKPAPDSVWQAMKLLQAVPESTCYVGDSDVDVETAHHAGIVCLGVTWGFRDREVLQEAGADYLLDSPQELWEWLNA